MNLTPHFTLADLIASATAARMGINNMPPPGLYPNLRRLAEGLERVRAVVQAPIIVTSGYRCPDLNRAKGGKRRSQHLEGLAADIRVPGFTAQRLAGVLAGNPAGLGIDQLILEHPEHPGGGWVHVSFGTPARGEVITTTGHPEISTHGLSA